VVPERVCPEAHRRLCVLAADAMLAAWLWASSPPR
jgi:hypothetical protein